METEWVDFRIIKAAVTMQMVLDRYGILLKKSGHELRGKCPIHRGSNNKHFTANVSKNVFKCFFAQCDAHGNVLDFVAAMEQCSVRDAAVKLRDWFRVGDTTEQSKQARRDEIEIKMGIYTDAQGAMYEVMGTASHTEHSEVLVVYRELFDQYRLMVMTVKTFHESPDASGQSHFTLVKKL
jgi:DNA primase